MGYLHQHKKYRRIKEVKKNLLKQILHEIEKNKNKVFIIDAKLGITNNISHIEKNLKNLQVFYDKRKRKIIILKV